MLLLSDLSEDIQIITEEKNGKRHLYLEGPNIIVNEPNRNNRIYSEKLMRPIVEDFIKEKVNTGSAYGEFGHPESAKVIEGNISHRICEMRWDKNHVIAKSVVIPGSKLGSLIEGMLETGGKVGMSTRGTGDVSKNKDGLNEVTTYKLITVDAVTDPSGPGCWVNGIMEGVEYFWDAAKGTYMESRIDEIKQKMKSMSVRELNERRLRLFNHYLDGLRKANK